jgi:hypothetical protein
MASKMTIVSESSLIPELSYTGFDPVKIIENFGALGGVENSRYLVVVSSQKYLRVLASYRVGTVGSIFFTGLGGVGSGQEKLTCGQLADQCNSSLIHCNKLMGPVGSMVS